MVSHDRAFLDNVVTQTLVAEGDGVWREYVGGYSDWMAHRTARIRDAAAATTTAATQDKAVTRIGRPPAVKLTFKEQRELAALPAELEALEREQHALTATMCAPEYHKRAAAAMKADRARAVEVEHLLAQKFERWAALDARAGKAS